MATPTQHDYERLQAFRRSIRQFLHFSEAAARGAGIDPQQHQLLLTLQAAGPVDGILVGDVAERLQLRHHTAVELIDRAEVNGLVSRERSDADRRRVRVKLSAAGFAVLERLSEAHLAELRAAAPALVAVLQDVLASDLPETASTAALPVLQ